MTAAALFSNKINKLIEMGARLTKHDVQLTAKLTKLQNRVTILTSTGGANLLTERVGFYLFEYQTKIVARDENFFRSDAFLEGLNLPNERLETVKDFAKAIDMIYSTASPREKNVIYDLIRDMLLDYIDYNLARNSSTN